MASILSFTHLSYIIGLLLHIKHSVNERHQYEPFIKSRMEDGVLLILRLCNTTLQEMDVRKNTSKSMHTIKQTYFYKMHYWGWFVLTSWKREMAWFWLCPSSCCFLKCSCFADWRHMVIISAQANILLLSISLSFFFLNKKLSCVCLSFCRSGCPCQCGCWMMMLQWGWGGPSLLPSACCPPPARCTVTTAEKLRLHSDS